MGRQAATRGQRWAVLGVILLAFLLRAYGLGRGELWFDEALSAVIAAKGWLGIISYTLSTPFEHPPFYYLSLHAWLRGAGNSEFALRFFSLIWGILLIPLVYRLMASFGGHSFGLLTALVAALSAVHIDHSQNARMYTILPVLSVLLWICFFRALETQRLRWWAGFLVAAILGLATHYYFSLLLLAPILFLLLGGPRYRRLALYLFVSLAGCALVAVGWLTFSTGFRHAVEQIIVGAGESASSLGQRIMHTAGGLVSEPPIIGHVLLTFVAILGAIFWSLPQPPRDHPVSIVGSRRFLLIWLLVPWLVALAIPYWLQDRHLAYLWPALAAFIACGLLFLRAKSNLLFSAGLVLLFVTTGYWLVRQDIGPKFEFGQIMTYIEDRSLPDDLVVMNQPAFWPFEDYYARENLATTYVSAPSQQAVDSRMKNLAGEHVRIWLGPIGAWTEDPDSMVEQWLATHAYQSHKEWFAGGGSAALYFTTHSLEPLTISPALQWEDGIRLLAVQSSSRTLVPSDAVRLSLTWQAESRLDSPRMVTLYLMDREGRVWARRQSEPCGGWCPAETWEPGSLAQDQHALLIPPGTPPGTYRLEVALYSPAEGRELGVVGSGPRVDLGSVQVVEPTPVETKRMPAPVIQNRRGAQYGNQITLLGFDLDRTDVQAGGTVALDLHWLAEGSPQEDYRLLLKLVLPDGTTVAQWDRPPVGDDLPTSVWQEGQYLRGPQQLGLSPQVAPGEYELVVGLLDASGQPVPFKPSGDDGWLRRLIPRPASQGRDALALASLHVTEPPERPHSFDLPTMDHLVDYALGQRVELLGYDLDTALAEPGGQIELTLYWQARGATDRPYKVFTHLSQEGLQPAAQHDGIPGEGCCPSDTWVEGEVIVDPHKIPLSAELVPGTYRLTAGMYHEATGDRLPVTTSDGSTVDGGQISVAEVMVRPRSTPMPTADLPRMDFRIYLPLVESNQ